MPANVIKSPADEKKWRKAKQRAAQAGHKKDWAYVMGIYKRMKKSSAYENGYTRTFALAGIVPIPDE